MNICLDSSVTKWQGTKIVHGKYLVTFYCKIMNLKWQLVSISNMRSILLIKLVATSNWQKFKWSWGVVLTTYLKRVNANYSFPFFHGLSACLTSPILWLGNGGIEQHCGLKIRQVSILWPKRVNANYFFFHFMVSTCPHAWHNMEKLQCLYQDNWWYRI